MEGGGRYHPKARNKDAVIVVYFHPISLSAFLLLTPTWKSGPFRAASLINKEGASAPVVVLGGRVAATPSLGLKPISDAV